MKRLFVLGAFVMLTLLAGSGRVLAQQDKMFSQYMFNMMALNPAYAGSRDVLSATALYRSQWMGLEGAPQTATFTADMPLNRERIGVGLQIYNDRAGVDNESGLFASYAFRVKVGERTTLALGLQAGAAWLVRNLMGVQLTPGNAGPVDPAFSANVNKALPNFGTGIFLSNDRSYIGVSVPRLIKNRLSDYEYGNYQAVQRRHAYGMAGFVLGISSSLKLKPSVLVKYAEGAPLGFDGNLNLWIAERVGIGASVRKNQFYTWTKETTDAIVGMVELQLTDQFRMGYAYDRTLNRLGMVIPSSHELMVRYEFGFTKNRILTPRYF
ncbi:PorP/SprF family type IX secretion system membrane protein [Nibrella viscosa]